MPKETRNAAPAPVLPRGVIIDTDLDEQKPEEVRRSIRYPDQEFYDNFYYICNKFKKSINEILIGYASQFIEDNKAYLPTKKK